MKFSPLNIFKSKSTVESGHLPKQSTVKANKVLKTVSEALLHPVRFLRSKLSTGKALKSKKSQNGNEAKLIPTEGARPQSAETSLVLKTESQSPEPRLTPSDLTPSAWVFESVPRKSCPTRRLFEPTVLSSRHAFMNFQDYQKAEDELIEIKAEREARTFKKMEDFLKQLERRNGTEEASHELDTALNLLREFSYSIEFSYSNRGLGHRCNRVVLNEM